MMELYDETRIVDGRKVKVPRLAVGQAKPIYPDDPVEVSPWVAEIVAMMLGRDE